MPRNFSIFPKKAPYDFVNSQMPFFNPLLSSYMCSLNDSMVKSHFFFSIICATWAITWSNSSPFHVYIWYLDNYMVDSFHLGNFVIFTHLHGGFIHHNYNVNSSPFLSTIYTFSLIITRVLGPITKSQDYGL